DTAPRPAPAVPPAAGRRRGDHRDRRRPGHPPLHPVQGPEEARQVSTVDRQIVQALDALARAVTDDLGPTKRDLQHPQAGPALDRMRALDRIDKALHEQMAQAARHAGANGASYADIGAALGILRGTARVRWPDALDAPRPG